MWWLACVFASGSRVAPEISQPFQIVLFGLEVQGSCHNITSIKERIKKEKTKDSQRNITNRRAYLLLLLLLREDFFLLVFLLLAIVSPPVVLV